MTKFINNEKELKDIGRAARENLKHSIFIESFGVEVAIFASKAEALPEIRKILQNSLGNRFREISHTNTEYDFRINFNKDKKDTIFINGEKLFTRFDRTGILNFLDSQIRLTIAEHAVEKLFIHAGVVEWKNRALIIPARSYRGKTTLVKELIKRGARYYSDEYAVIDKNGKVEPFPKTLSVRGIIDKYRQVEIPAADFGGETGTEIIPVGMFLLTEFKENARWKPKVLKSGEGILEIMKHCVSVRKNPVFTLNALNKAVNCAIIVKSFRGDVKKSVDSILSCFENNVTSN